MKEKTSKYEMVLLCLTMFVSVILCSPASAATFNVPGDYSAIQDAINAAADDDTIIVGPGTYTENINFIGKTVSVLSSAGPANTTIDGGGVGSVVTIATGEGQDAAIQGFTITNGFAPFGIMGGGGIYCHTASPTITGCIIEGNSTHYNGAGIYCFNASPVITNCIIRNNSLDGATDKGAGIYSLLGSPTIVNSTITGNSAVQNGGGIYIDSSSSMVVVNSILWGNEPNEIWLNGGTINITFSDIEDGYTGEGNLNCEPDFAGVEDYHLSASSCCKDVGTDGGVYEDIDGDERPQGGAFDIGADEVISSSEQWASASVVGAKAQVASDILNHLLIVFAPLGMLLLWKTRRIRK